MVRRAAAQKLGPYAAVMERDAVSRELLPLFTDLTQDGKGVLPVSCVMFANAGMCAQ